MINQSKLFVSSFISISFFSASFSCWAFQASDINGKEFYMENKVLSVSISGPTYQSLKEFTDVGFSLASLGISPGDYYALTLTHTFKNSPGVYSVSSQFCTFSTADVNVLSCSGGIGISYNPESHSITEKGFSPVYYEAGYGPKS